MSEIKLISPMLDGFCIGDPISDQNGVRSCPAMNESQNDRFILKVVSIPASQSKLDALLITGAYTDAESANRYFKELSDNVVSEINLLNKLSERGKYLPIIQWQIVPMENGETGFDVYMLSSYKRTLKHQFYKEPLTHLNAVNLGLDICEALQACREEGYLYTDLKPENIFVTLDNEYKIGDIGFISQDALHYTSLPAQYRSAYTAPEVSDAFSSLSTTMDIYALGLVLYQAYNNGALPFAEDAAPAQTFPAPDYADYEMSEIILKACDPDPANRWQNPLEMRQALISYMQRNGANDTPIVPPTPIFVAQPDDNQSEIEDVLNDTDSEIVEFTNDGNADATTERAEQDIQQEAQAESAEIVDETSEIITEDTPPLSEESEEFDSEVVENPNNLIAAALRDVMAEEESKDEADSLTELSELLSIDEEELSEFNASDANYDQLSEETSDILEQADNLAAHDVPDMESVIEQVTAIEEAESSQVAPITEQSDDTFAGQFPEEYDPYPSDAQSTMVFSSANGSTTEDAYTQASEGEEIEYSVPQPIKRKKRWLGLLVALLVLIGLGVGGFFGYKYYYIQSADIVEITTELDTITVVVKSNADHDLLTVYCTSMGHTKQSKLRNGKATFTNLDPDQRYEIEVKISGFHKLQGKITDFKHTSTQVALDALTVKVGETDGSAVITFTTKQPYDGQWSLSYVTEGEEIKTVTSDTRSFTLNDLTIGKTYDITISPSNGNNWVTNNTCSFNAQPLILAQNITIANYKDGILNLVWDTPEGANVASWTVHCYNDTDYNKTITVSDRSASFEALDPMKSYTVEIYAEEQSKGQTLHVDDATFPIENFAAQIVENNFIELSWTCQKPTPTEGWIINYSINGVDAQAGIPVAENSLLFKEVIPGATYIFSIEAGNGAPVISKEVEIVAPEAENYESNYDDISLKKDNITLSMCTPPDQEDWSYKSLYTSNYTTSIKLEEKIGFVIRATKFYSATNAAEIFVLYVIKNEEGDIVMFSSEERIWSELWDYYYGALTVPEIPKATGKYTIDVYFNGGHVGTEEFEITE